MSEAVNYWEKKLKKYSNEEWADQPTLFAQKVKQYLPKRGSLLELGGGLGQDGKWFKSQGYKVTIADLTRLVAADIETTVLDMSNPLPFKKESFDIVYAHLSLHYFSAIRTQKLFNEIYDVLKKGGVFAFLVNSTDDPEAVEGDEIEINFRNIGGINKRFFDIESAKTFTKQFKILLCDNKGTSYKDLKLGLTNLIEFVGVKE
jgi:SAM-dependent methyltransferase